MAVTKREVCTPLCPENTAKFRRISANTVPYFHPLQVRRSGITNCVNSLSFFPPFNLQLLPFHETFFPALSYLSPRTGPPPVRRHPGMSDHNRGFFPKAPSGERKRAAVVMRAVLGKKTLLWSDIAGCLLTGGGPVLGDRYESAGKKVS